MAHVHIPKDLSRVKSKFILGLTYKQTGIVAFAGFVSFSIFFAVRGSTGTPLAMILLFLSASPFIAYAFFTKDGLDAKQWIKIIIRYKIFPGKRIYKKNKSKGGTVENKTNERTETSLNKRNTKL